MGAAATVQQTRVARMALVSEDVDAAKRDLREQFLERRRGLSAETIAEARAAVRAAVLTKARQQGWRRVAGYLPLRTEPGSVRLLEDLSALGIEVLVPVLRPDRDLDWAQWQAARPQIGPANGVAAIARVDAVLAPALAVAIDGTRLGRGGGSYDRALARVAPSTPVAALLHDGELVQHLPRADWDRRVTAVVTPAGWQELGTPTPAPE
jgi:5-formyltetrahydrofolate cyclo-ligase